MFVPTLIMFASFTPEFAIPLSNVMIAAASLANYIQLSRKVHPTRDGPLIDYPIALLMQPASLAGTVVGFFVNQVLPDWTLVSTLSSLRNFVWQTILTPHSLSDGSHNLPHW